MPGGIEGSGGDTPRRRRFCTGVDQLPAHQGTAPWLGLREHGPGLNRYLIPGRHGPPSDNWDLGKAWRSVASRRSAPVTPGWCQMSFQALRVLIIDDHASCRAAARELLQRRGFAVVAEADGAQAGLEAAETVAPDAVVLDIHLPDGNGIDVCRALTEANPALVVLLVSAEADHGRWASDCGAVAFVPKARLASVALAGLLREDGGQDLAGQMTG